MGVCQNPPALEPGKVLGRFQAYRKSGAPLRPNAHFSHSCDALVTPNQHHLSQWCRDNVITTVSQK